MPQRRSFKLVRLIGIVLLCGFSTAAANVVWQDIANELMSPACPGRTLVNCTSGQSEQWRELIKQKLAQGESKEDIIRHFVEIRGEEILAAPPKRGFALAAWLLPLVVVLNGAGLIVILTYRWVRNRPTSTANTATDPDHVPGAESHAAMDVYRQRLNRELEDV
jgi:cytochrome c-type biogenesis protein CcmH